MRTTTAGELALLHSLNRAIAYRVKIANGSGTLIDLSTYVERITIDQNIDQPISSCSIEFRRDDQTTKSLAPLRTDSTLNLKDDGITYSPQLDIGRSVTVEIATTALGASILSGDHKLLFKGVTDQVSFEHSPVSVTSRDLGGVLVDRWVEAPKSYGTGPGRAVESVMQDLLDDTFGGGIVTLYTPVSPSFLITTYQQQRMSVMDALQALALLIGWDVRYKWDDGTGAFRLTFSQPPRSKTTPDFTFGPADYIDITTLDLDVTNIRNVVQVSYKSVLTGARAVTTSTDATSVTKYGRRFFGIQEGDTSPIDTAAEAQAEGDAALADLKDPKANQEVEAPFFWPGDLGDLYRFTDNRVHYNSNQDLATVTMRHELSQGHHRTVFRTRGSPAGAYNTWLGKGQPLNPVALPPVATIRHAADTATDAAWNLVFTAVAGTGGGGTNLTYVVGSKISFAAETILSSGNSTAFPLALTVNRDHQHDTDIRFTVTDAATQISNEMHINVPARRGEVTITGGSIALRRNVQFDDTKFALRATESDGSTKLSDALNPQGSISPTPIDINPMSYVAGGPSSGNMWISWSWGSFTIYRSDGTTISVSASSALPTPPSPTLSQVAGGALAGRTRFVRIGYIKNAMIFRVGAEASIVLSASNLLKVTGPASPSSSFDGWIPLVGSSSNNEFTQTSAPGAPQNAVAFGTDWTEPVGGADITGTTPYDNTNWPNAVTAAGRIASTTYFFYAWWDLVASFLAFSDRGNTTKSAAAAVEQNKDTRVSITTGAVTGLTPAGGTGGSGTPLGGKFL